VGYDSLCGKDYLKEKNVYTIVLQMRGIKNAQLYEIKSAVEELPDNHQKAILKILVESDCVFTENQNGVFFDIKALNKEVVHKIKEYIQFYNDTQENEKKRETEETEIRIELNV
jgi:hypothetical protein